MEMAMQTNVKRLNWGCGGWTPAGWINSDIKQGRGIDISADIRQGLPLENASIDYIVSIHALPEMPYDDLVPACRNCAAYLNLAAFCGWRCPICSKACAYERGDRDYFLVPDDDVKSLGAKLIVQLIWYGYSRTLFIAEFIEEMLYKAGFARIDHCEYQQTQSQFPEIIELDNRENESLFVEATK